MFFCQLPPSPQCRLGCGPLVFLFFSLLLYVPTNIEGSICTGGNSSFSSRDRSSPLNMVGGPFQLSNYDWIGLDLDNTLAEYNLKNTFKLEYDLIIKYLVEVKGYSSEFFPSLDVPIIDFITRGVFVDFKKGNILKANKNGTIVKATHGTKEMTGEEISAVYGTTRTWDLLSMFKEDPHLVWEGEPSHKIRTFLDFSDTPVPLIFGLMIDGIDQSRKETPQEYDVWPDLLESIVDMYRDDGPLYTEMFRNPSDYLLPCDSAVIDWIKNLKKSKATFLLTGSSPKIASFIAEQVMGPDYRQHFDLIVYGASKPKFFIKQTPFKNMKGETVDNLVLGQEYVGGNWTAMYKVMCESGRGNKSIYFGDSIIQDVYAPKLVTGLDSVSVVEELAAESTYPQFDTHPYSAYISSSFWGSYLGRNFETVWGQLVQKNAKLIISRLKDIAVCPLDHVFVPLWDSLA